MKTILLTGGRAPAALELARLFHAAGWRVVMAESLRWHLSRPSRALAANYLVPWPNRDPDGYLDALLHIVRHEHVELLIPTFEEIFWIVRGRDRLAPHCRVFAPDGALLRALHSKWEFVQLAGRHGLPVPPTTLLTDRTALLKVVAARGQEVVLKPVWSRFAARTIVRPTGAAAVARVEVGPEQPWVAQDFIAGRPLSTYSIAREGRLLAHTAYPMDYTSGIGPALAYTPLEHHSSLAWVRALVSRERFTGQLGVDFIEMTDGALFALECNPRTTSGVHLFADTPGFVNLFLDETEHPGPPLIPQGGQPTVHTWPMIFWALRQVRSWTAARRWAGTFFAGRDPLYAPHDWLPYLCQAFTLMPLVYRSWRHGVSLAQAATLDIEWNGP